MTRRELFKKAAEKLDMRQQDVEEVVKAIEDIAYDAIRKEDVHLLDGLILYTKIRDARTMRNPKTGEPVAVPAKRVPAVRIGKRIKEAAY